MDCSLCLLGSYQPSLPISSVAPLFCDSSWEKGTWEVDVWNLAYLEMSVFHPFLSVDGSVGHWVLVGNHFTLVFWCIALFFFSGFLCCCWESRAVLPGLLYPVHSWRRFFVSLVFWILRMMYSVVGLFIHCAGHSVGPSVWRMNWTIHVLQSWKHESCLRFPPLYSLFSLSRTSVYDFCIIFLSSAHFSIFFFSNFSEVSSALSCNCFFLSFCYHISYV